MTGKYEKFTDAEVAGEELELEHDTNQVEDFKTGDKESSSNGSEASNKVCPPKDGFKVIVAGCVIFGLALAIGLTIDIYIGKPPRGHGAISSDYGVCSNIGVKVLHDESGSAVDAAVAVAFCLAVVQPASSGLSSGGFMLIHTAEGKDVTIDFNFVAPKNATQDMFKKDKSLAEKGGLAVAVPGFLRGLEMAHKLYGKVKWNALIEPSIELAEKGFQVNKYLAKKIKDNAANLPKSLKDLVEPGGKPLQDGSLLKLPNLAGLLKNISLKGANAFYDGDLAKEIVDEVKANKGILELEDLKDYKAMKVNSLNMTFEGYKILSTPAPSSGIVALAALNILHRLPLKLGDQHKTINFHYLAEVFKFAFTLRSGLGDPLVEKNMKKVTDSMMSDKTADSLSKLISPNKTYPASHYAQANTKGTSNAVVLGTNGDLVSIVSTIGSPFGAKLMTKSGVILNNGMDSFSSPGFSNHDQVSPAKANYIKPGKRPLSAAAPVLIFNKQTPCSDQYVIGSSGGTKAITATVQVILDLIKYKQSAKDAVKKPRIHHQLLPNKIYAEGAKFKKAGLSQVLDELKKIGHTVDNSSDSLGYVNIISQQKKRIIPYSDSRKGGGEAQF